MKPTIKRNRANTYHQDGTLSYWDVLDQRWKREFAADISNRVLSTMNEWDRRRIEQHAYTH